MQRVMVGLRRNRIQLALVAVLLVAAALRCYNINWDGGKLTHPDERSTVAFYAPTMHWPNDWSTAFDPQESTLNPFWDRNNQHRRSYTYGHFPLYLLTITANLAHNLAPLAERLGASPETVQALATANGSPGFAYVGRFLMALADTATVYLVYLIARRLYGQAAGLLAAAFSAFTVTQIQLAHFFAVDPISTTFTLLALYGAMLMVERRTAGAAALTGLGAALAIASKFSALPVLAAPVVAVLIIAWQSREAGPTDSAQALRHLLLAFVVAFLVFAVTSPFVLLDWSSFVQAVIKEQGAMASGRADMPFTRQYRGTVPYSYQIEQQLRWGMGWPLGIVAFLGLGWVLVRTLLRRAKPGELILLSWIVPYFGFTGLFLAKFMRYMVPVVPLFTVMGVGMLCKLQVASRKSQVARFQLPSLLIAVTLGGAIFWALAFVVGVYGTEHTWITASRWIYDHVPDGSVLASEHWDDDLPLGLPDSGANIGAHGYRLVELPMYEDDNEEKYQRLRSRLSEADYIVLSSNRLYGAILRLPQRYPMSSKYYQLLFAGQLGFEEVAEFTTYPRLGPFTFNDDSADESFTVYDHPKPIIFRKVRELSGAEWDALLGDSWDEAIPGYVGAPTPLARFWGVTSRPSPPSKAKEGKTLLLDRPVDQLPVIDDFRWNGLANRYHLFAVIFWWLAVVLVGLAAWPVTFVIFRRFSDQGYILAKSLGLIIVAYLVWVSASLRLLRNSLFTIILALALLSFLSFYLFRRYKETMVAFWRDSRRLILLNEALFAGAFLLFVVIRMFNPDLWQPWLGGEKPMEFAFLNAILKTPHFPPYDPYFAGGYINYYYYGQFIVGLVIKLTGIMPSVAFNLAIPMLFALTVGNAFCVGYNLGRARSSVLAGLLAVVFVAVLGNLDGMVHLVERLGGLGGSGFKSSIPGLEGLVRVWPGLLKLIQGQPMPPLDYFGRTRVIPGTISEFPYFSFLFADLHPHMIGIPFTILVLALALSIVLDGRRREAAGPWSSGTCPGPFVLGPKDQGRQVQGPRTEGCEPLATAVRYLSLPICLGALAVTNTWDLPTYLGLIAVAFLLRERLAHGKWKLVWPVVSTVAVGGLSLLLYWPFFAHYKALNVGVGLALTRGRTDLASFLTVWGFFLFIVVTFLLVELVRQRDRLGVLRFVRVVLARWEVLPHLAELYKALVHRQTSGYLLVLCSLGGMLLLAVALAVLKFWVLAFMLPLVVGALLLLLRDPASPEELFVSLLVFTGLLVAAGCEVFYLKDHLGGDQVWWRMNTIFKFYIQVWVMLGIAAAVALPRLWALRQAPGPLALSPVPLVLWPKDRGRPKYRAQGQRAQDMARLRRWQSAAGRRAWIAGLAFLFFSSLLYPILYTPARVDDRFPGARPPVGTLDGMAFMTVGSYTWPDNNRIELRYDYEALQWLLANIKGTPVVAEAALPYYREGGLRVATYTGLPTLLGAHQNEQRYASQVGERDGQARDFFNTPDIARALQLIRELRISYIYVGQLERAVYDPAGLAKFDEMEQRGELEVVYENEMVKICRVRGLRR